MNEPKVRVKQLNLTPPATTALSLRICDGLAVAALSSRYTETEYLISGVAHSYTGSATGPVDAADRSGCRYTTRVLVRRPRDPATASGRVMIEPFNTTAGEDRDALWCHVGSLLQHHGDVWIGVSVRASSARQLRRVDPGRYGDLNLPSNDLCWDVLTQLSELIRSRAASLVPDIAIANVYLGGYSQSGTDTATYASAFGAQTDAFDGYFPTARAASLSPIASGTSRILTKEIAAIGGCGAPVIDVESQTDVEGFRAELVPGKEYVNPGGAWGRRADSDLATDRFRLYEVPGAPHIAQMPGCDGASTFPMSALLRAALMGLFRWAEIGLVPPSAPRIVLDNHGVISAAATDEIGNALGGLRSPFVDVPLACYHAHAAPGIMCQLAGREVSLPSDVLQRTYGTRERYLSEFTRSLDAAIAAGVLLATDRAELASRQTDKATEAFEAAKLPAVPRHRRRRP